MILPYLTISFIAGIISAIIVYFAFNDRAAPLWAFIAAFLPNLPVFILIPFGVSNLGSFLVFSHTIGIAIWPILLVILDIFLVEARILKYVLIFLKFLHIGATKTVEKAEKFDRLIERLENYHIIPMPTRLGRVYLVGIIAGIVNLAIIVVI